MTATLTASGITVARRTHTVLDGVGLTIAPGHRIGIVGPNGAGKTTLLRVLAGELRPDSGRVTAAPPSLTVGYLAQETSATPGESVLDALARTAGVTAVAAELERASADLGSARPGADDAYAVALDRYLALGAADFDHRAEEVCADVGLDPGRLGTDLSVLSGGQRARARLAAVLVSRFDVFLLDEPTNDLDFDGLARLEEYVTGLSGGAAIVSHDRRFLERTVTEVVELDAHTHRATAFGGGWSAYLDAREVARRHEQERYDAHAAARGDAVERIRTQRQWASVGVAKEKRAPKDNDKAQRGFRINNTEHLASKVRTSERRLARLDAEGVEKPWEPWELHLSFGGQGRSGDVVARLDGAVIERIGWQLGPVTLEIGWADRVAITGPNGAGKTTLVGALLGEIPLTAGTQWIGPGVVVGHLDQSRLTFDDGPASRRAVIDQFIAATGLVQAEARSLLAKFGLDADHVGRPAATLSPGERTRAVLAVLMAAEVNCLVLDEPTNHLDLPAIEELESALDRYTGTLLVITHDRQFLERLAVSRAIEVRAGGTVEA